MTTLDFIKHVNITSIKIDVINLFVVNRILNVWIPQNIFSTNMIRGVNSITRINAVLIVMIAHNTPPHAQK